jgi:predicted DNA-binding protein
MTEKKLISIRISPETENQITQLMEMDGAKQTVVIARAVELYFEKKVNAEAGKTLRAIPFEEIEKGKVYLCRLYKDGSIENITQEEGEVRVKNE